MKNTYANENGGDYYVIFNSDRIDRLTFLIVNNNEDKAKHFCTVLYCFIYPYLSTMLDLSYYPYDLSVPCVRWEEWGQRARGVSLAPPISCYLSSARARGPGSLSPTLRRRAECARTQ